MFLTTCQCLPPAWWLVTGLSWPTKTSRLFFSSRQNMPFILLPAKCKCKPCVLLTTAFAFHNCRSWRTYESLAHSRDDSRQWGTSQKTTAKMKTKGNSKMDFLWEKTEKPCGFKRGHKEREMIEADKNMEGWKTCVRDQNTIHIIQLAFCTVPCWRNLLLH